MADLIDGICRWLHDRGAGVYDPTGGVEAADWSIFYEHMPSGPDKAIAVALYGGPESDSRNPWDYPSLQVRVRGTKDPRDSRQRATLIYGLLHGLTSTYLPDGTWLSTCIGVQSGAVSLGVDQNGTHEHVVNFRLSVTNPTANRPQL